MTASAIDTETLLTRVIMDFAADAQANANAQPLFVSDSQTMAAAARQAGALVKRPAEAADLLFDDLPGRLPVAIVDANAAFASAQAGIELISQLRDLHADQVLVIGAACPQPGLARPILISLGFHRWQKSMDENHLRDWYVFDLAHYKVTPDWLNPRHWANPELWDKYRW